MKKYRVDVYSKFNADMLVSRNYVFFMTEAEAIEYGNSAQVFSRKFVQNPNLTNQ